MKTLRKKLVRDLWRLRYQAFTIAVLVGCGIASFVAAVAASASMQASRDAFYAEAHLADVFARVQRAPRSFLDQLRALPGVAAVEGRIVGDFRLEIGGGSEPVVARFVSLPWPAERGLNQTRLRAGRYPEPGRSDELVLSEALAEAWGLTPGAEIIAVVNERRATLRVVGVAVAPDFTLTMGRSGLTDPKHFGVVWMDEDALATATNSVGAFNDVALALAATANEAETIDRVDALLAPYGGLGAIGRENQPAAKLVDQKIAQLARLSRTLPVVFLGIASFLLNVLLGRIVGTQREQIATLKALGYATRELLAHYLELAAVICLLGVFFGVALGILGAHALLRVYALYFKFPAFLFRMDLRGIVSASVVAVLAGLGGTWLAVRKAVQVPPAEAMRPEAPPAYRRSALDGLYAALAPIARMVLRDAQRRPLRLLLSSGSIALATAIVLAGNVFSDSIYDVLRLQFEVARREDVTATLADARPSRAMGEIAHVPGVLRAEGERTVPVRLYAGARKHTTAILGLGRERALHRLLDADKRELSLPASGLALSRGLADELAVHAGDEVLVEVLEADRRTLRVPVAALVDDLLGFSGYMDADELARLLGEAPRVNVVLASVDRPRLDEVIGRLNAVPGVAYVSRPDLDRALVRAQVADSFTALTVMLAVFAAAIAVGVVYNNARIALEMRSRDLATMRILGFTRGELSAVLLGEQAIQVGLGVAPGLVLGKAIGSLVLSTVDKELLRIPIVVAPASYVGAVCVVVFAALASALVVRSQSDHLDLVAVLKARD